MCVGSKDCQSRRRRTETSSLFPVRNRHRHVHSPSLDVAISVKTKRSKKEKKKKKSRAKHKAEGRKNHGRECQTGSRFCRTSSSTIIGLFFFLIFHLHKHNQYPGNPMHLSVCTHTHNPGLLCRCECEHGGERAVKCLPSLASILSAFRFPSPVFRLSAGLPLPFPGCRCLFGHTHAPPFVRRLTECSTDRSFFTRVFSIPISFFPFLFINCAPLMI